MAVLPRALLWQRLDTTGTEQVLLDDRSGLYARGTIVAAAPVAYACAYEVQADRDWSTTRLTVSVEGAGWLRTAKLERAAGRWHVSAGEQGNLDTALVAAGHPRVGQAGTDDADRLRKALDVDLGYSPLTNTLPIRRLSLATAPAGTAQSITVAWVLLPSLAVVAGRQTYTALGPGRVRYASGTFTADLDIDDDGYVMHYPGLARRV